MHSMGLGKLFTGVIYSEGREKGEAAMMKSRCSKKRGRCSGLCDSALQELSSNSPIANRTGCAVVCRFAFIRVRNE